MDSMKKRNYIPIMLDALSLNWLVIGGGKVATRKVKSLIEQGVDTITVAAPSLSAYILECAEQGLLQAIEDVYHTRFLQQKHIVFAATNNSALNREISRDAKLHALLVCNVSEQEQGNFISPASFRRDDVVFSVSSQGKSPVIAKMLAEAWASEVDERYISCLPLLDQLRQDLKKDVENATVRQQLMNEAIPIVLDGKIANYREWYQTLLKHNG